MVYLNSHIHPKLTEEVLEILKTELQIETVAEFIASNVDNISARSRLNVSTINQIRSHLFSCYPLATAIGIDRGTHLRRALTISSGVSELDQLLGGGFQPGRIYEVFGPPSSGKSQLGLTLAANALNKNQNVAFVDSKNDFYINRFIEIGNAISGDQSIEDCLDHVLILKKFEAIDVVKGLGSVIKLVKSGDNQFFNKLNLIILDSIASLLLPLLIEERKGLETAGAMANKITHLLRDLAHVHDLCIVVTNHATVDQSGALKPSLGRLFNKVPNIRLQLSKEGQQRTVIIKSGPHPGSSCNAKIAKCGWTSA